MMLVSTNGRLPRYRIVVFVLGSLALHSLLLWNGSPRTLAPEPPIGEVMLRVQLQTTNPDRAHVETPPSPLLTAASDPTAHVLPTTENDQDRAVDAKTAAATVLATTASADRDALQNYLLGLLQSELSRTLSYPPLARERGWQGTVLLSVAVAPDGALRGTRLLRSSGYALLDAVSLDCLRRIHALPRLSGWRHADPIEVILPIRFRLADNS
jgi:periplasmic protein TonB